MEIGKIISDLQSIIGNPISNINLEREEFPVGFTFYHILERTDCSLTSLKLLANDNIAKHDHGVGLISRNLLSDFFVLSYIIAATDTREDHKWFYSLYNSDINKMKGFIDLYKDKDFISNENFDAITKIYNDENTIYGVIKMNNTDVHFPTIKKITEEFMGKFKDHQLAPHIKESYDLWTLLSKYEHIGIHSYSMTRELDIEKVKGRLKFILLIAVFMSGFCLDELKQNDAAKDAMKLYKDIYDALKISKETYKV